MNLRGAATASTFVGGIDYNARGQRQQIEYGAGATTTYEYDPNSFRLVRSQTVRNADNVVLRDLSYVYDPIGNVTQNSDQAQQTVFFNNQVIAPVYRYSYDAIYRLINATGRELIGQQGPSSTGYDDSPRMSQPLPADGSALRNYSEAYAYDAAGNVLAIAHTAANGSWTRNYAYDESNPSPTNNRLTSTSVGAVKESNAYDAHGSITQMAHLPTMQWDFKDQLHLAQQQVVNSAPGDTTYYVYDAGGQRVRKVNQRANGSKKSERIYLGGFEIYREYDAGGAVTLDREMLHIMDDTRRIALVETKTIDTSVPGAALPSTLTRYQFDNHIGSAWLELDDSAAIISYEEYFPYGSTSFQSGRSSIEVSLKRYRYASKERDEITGFYYHGARYYAPWLGRWTSCDPGGMLDGMNLYSFTRNNPLNLKDPSGAASERDDELPGPILDMLSHLGGSGDQGSSGGSSIFDDVGNALSAAWDWIKGTASTAWNWIKGAAAAAWDWTKQAAGAVWNWTKGAASSAWNGAKVAVSSAWNWVKERPVQSGIGSPGLLPLRGIGRRAPPPPPGVG